MKVKITTIRVSTVIVSTEDPIEFILPIKHMLKYLLIQSY